MNYVFVMVLFEDLTIIVFLGRQRLELGSLHVEFGGRATHPDYR